MSCAIRIALVAALAWPLTAAWADDALDARDATIVETLLRVKSIDVNARPKLREAVLRHLERHKGTFRYVDLVKRLKLKGLEPELLALGLEKPASTEGVLAGTLLLERGGGDAIGKTISGEDDARALQSIKLLGYIGTKDAVAMLRPLVTSGELSRQARTAAATGLGRNLIGQRHLLELVTAGEAPAELNFAIANALFTSPDPAIRAQAKKHLKLPAGADANPLPPVAELVKRPGDAAKGLALFKAKATCIKCHKVRGEGKEVGPDLSEIGSKLSREAMFVSILDPSAGISHNYETYAAILDSGNVVTGIKTSETDDSIVLRTAEAIDKAIAKDEVDELTKMPTSLMPADLQKTMSADELVDVVEYLTTLKKRG